MTTDVEELLSRVMKERSRIVGTDRDPGDITIGVQDDSLMVTVNISKYDEETEAAGLVALVPDGVGPTVAEALTSALERLQRKPAFVWASDS